MLNETDHLGSDMSVCDALETIERTPSPPTMDLDTLSNFNGLTIAPGDIFHNFIIGSDDVHLPDSFSESWPDVTMTAVPVTAMMGAGDLEDEPELPPLAPVHRFDPRSLRVSCQTVYFLKLIIDIIYFEDDRPRYCLVSGRCCEGEGAHVLAMQARQVEHHAITVDSSKIRPNELAPL